MKLYIDSTDFNSVSYFLISANKPIKKKKFKIDPHKSHETLGKLDEFLKSSKVGKSHIKTIVVNKGPGSYTGTRVGVTHALALGFAWDIPVQALNKPQFDAVIKKST